jgi:hypothetical protein
MNVASVEISGYDFCRNVFLPWVTHPSREERGLFSPDDTLMEEVTELPR